MEHGQVRVADLFAFTTGKPNDTGDLNLDAVSIILPTYNRAHCIRGAVESVLGQTYPHFELIIIDDGSTDYTAEVVKQYLMDKRIIYVRQENSGAAAARNHGLSVRKGNLVAFIDSDDVWEPDKLRIQISVLDALHAAGIVCSDFSATRDGILIEASHIRSYFSVLDDYKLSYEDVFMHRLIGRVDGLKDSDVVHWGNIYPTMIFGNIILTSTCLCRSEVFDKAGVFDASFRTLEDYDLFLRITKNTNVAFVPMPLTRYGYGQDQLIGENHFHQLCINLIDIFNKNIGSIEDRAFLQANKTRIRHHLGKYLAMHGYYHFARNEMKEAARCFIQSTIKNPLDLKSLVYLAFSCFPLYMTNFVRRHKSKKTLLKGNS